MPEIPEDKKRVMRRLSPTSYMIKDQEIAQITVRIEVAPLDPEKRSMSITRKISGEAIQHLLVGGTGKLEGYCKEIIHDLFTYEGGFPGKDEE